MLQNIALDKDDKKWYSKYVMYNCSPQTDDSYILHILRSCFIGQFRKRGGYMEKKSQLIVADARILPDVFTKVLEVKKLMAQKGEKSFASAWKRIGISRSAYYKYKDCVFSYEELFNRRIINLYLLLNDQPGVLSSVLVYIHGINANILTVNQSIPVDGAAAVNISLRLTEDYKDELAALNSINSLDGVLEVKIISTE